MSNIEAEPNDQEAQDVNGVAVDEPIEEADCEPTATEPVPEPKKPAVIKGPLAIKRGALGAASAS